MALDQAYFDGIHIDVAKKKYYNANKVEAVLEDIRGQALALQAENDQLRRQMEELRGSKDVIGDALVSAKTIAQQIIREAQEQADATLAGAREKADTILAEAKEQSRVQLLAGASREEEQRRWLEDCVQRIQGRLIDCADEIGADWRALRSGTEAPEDLEEKVNAIAQELFAVSEEE